MAATKQQEREALEKIRKIVEALGEDSYIGTALEGCLEDAETNIRDDVAFSMKDRYETTAARLEETRKVAGEQEVKLIEKSERIGVLEQQLAEVKKRMLSDWLYKRLWMLVTDTAEMNRKRMAEAAEIMADMAEHPQDIAFQNAVKTYRHCKEKAESCEQMERALDEIGKERV